MWSSLVSLNDFPITVSLASVAFILGYAIRSRRIQRLKKNLLEMEKELLRRDEAELGIKNTFKIVSRKN